MRSSKRCYVCKTGIRGSMAAHLSTDKHNAATAPTVRRKREPQYRPPREPIIEDWQDEYAAAELGIVSAVVWEADPEPLAPWPSVAAAKVAPCPRCGRSDFRTDGGRAWHVDNAPDCKRYVNPQKHEYRMVAA